MADRTDALKKPGCTNLCIDERRAQRMDGISNGVVGP